MERDDWDRRYGASDLVWTAEPNRWLVAEAAGLPARRALDLACGEGRNAVWLARQGWQVTAVDFSPVALEKARRLAAGSGGPGVDWVEADVHTYRPKPAGCDLVLLAYLHLPGSDRCAVHRRRPGRWHRAASCSSSVTTPRTCGTGSAGAGPGRPVHAGQRRGRPRAGRRAGGRAGRAGAAAGPDAGRRAAGGGRAGPGPPLRGTPTGVTTEKADMEYGQGIELSLPYPEAVQAVKAALKEQGFGVLTEIDVKATMREKIDGTSRATSSSAPATPTSPRGPSTSTGAPGCCCRATSSSAMAATGGPSSRCSTRMSWSPSPSGTSWPRSRTRPPAYCRPRSARCGRTTQGSRRVHVAPDRGRKRKK